MKFNITGDINKTCDGFLELLRFCRELNLRNNVDYTTKVTLNSLKLYFKNNDNLGLYSIDPAVGLFVIVQKVPEETKFVDQLKLLIENHDGMIVVLEQYKLSSEETANIMLEGFMRELEFLTYEI